MITGGGISTLSQARARLGIALVVVFALSFLSHLSPAKAASFDCSKAELSPDKLICQALHVASQDEKMAIAYNRAIARLSADQVKILNEAQYQWISSLRARCGKPDSTTETVTSCIKDKYDGRIEEISVTGPYIFRYVEETTVVDSENNGSLGKPEKLPQKLSFPQILSPLNAETIRWNNLTRDKARKDFAGYLAEDEGHAPDFTYSLSVVGAFANFIGTEETVSWMGPAHEYGGTNYHNQLLSNAREMTLDQLFTPTTVWQKELTMRANTYLKNESVDQAKIDVMADGFLNYPHLWTMSADALTLILDDGASMRPNSGEELTIPWRDLKPYLRDDLPIKLNTE